MTSFSFRKAKKENVCKITINDWVLEVRKEIWVVFQRFMIVSCLYGNEIKNIQIL